MGRRSGSASAVGLFVAFIENRSWKQAELAERLGVTVPTVRRLLTELREAGCPLERQEEHPHVYWSLPNGWIPGAVALDGDEVRVALRLLARLPKSAGRDRLLAKLLRLTPHAPAPVANSVPQPGEGVLETIEEAAARRVTLRFEYHSASTGDRRTRTASVHRFEYGRHVRFIATCHDAGTLKRFRVDGVTRAAIDVTEPFRPVSEAELEAFVGRSVDGFAGEGAPVACAFVVRSPEADWACRNLPEGKWQVERRRDRSVRVTTTTSAVEVVARFVVGLGASATCLTEPLRSRVAELAIGALGAAPEQELSRDYSAELIATSATSASARAMPQSAKH